LRVGEVWRGKKPSYLSVGILKRNYILLGSCQTPVFAPKMSPSRLFGRDSENHQLRGWALILISQYESIHQSARKIYFIRAAHRHRYEIKAALSHHIAGSIASSFTVSHRSAKCYYHHVTAATIAVTSEECMPCLLPLSLKASTILRIPRRLKHIHQPRAPRPVKGSSFRNTFISITRTGATSSFGSSYRR
jgi:hypothetical protein